MKTLYLCLAVSLLFLLQACSASRKTSGNTVDTRNTAIKSRVVIKKTVAPQVINTKNIPADSIVRFAESLRGYPYKYGGADRKKGFDCSGLLYYSFNHFKISVPRTSVSYTNAGKEIPIADSKRGDIILFTGTDANSGVVGHMGLITKNEKGRIEFIHAASGEGGGVIYSGMNAYFIPRFVKVIRVFNSI